MNTSLKFRILLLCLLLFYQPFFAQHHGTDIGYTIANDKRAQQKKLIQTSNYLPYIHPIEEAQKHYLTLQTLDSRERKKYAWMDSIVYPPALYKNNTLLFALTQPSYLTSSQVDYLTNAVQFPANSSEQTRAELDYLLKLQESRTEEQIERVLLLAKIGYWPDANHLPTHPSYQKNLKHLFFELREVVDENCNAKSYPHTSKLLQGVMNDMRLMEFAVKYHLLRARPYQLEPKLAPLKKISSPSFASGHTLWAYIQAYVLGELIPDKRKAFVNLAYEIGVSREIMGVHYPSDEEAARQLAHRMLLLMWHTDKFQDDFQKAKKEWE
ncbi:MAG: phosphatase PAP2 family protein [Thermonemataceae bacterium]